MMSSVIARSPDDHLYGVGVCLLEGRGFHAGGRGVSAGLLAWELDHLAASDSHTRKLQKQNLQLCTIYFSSIEF